MIFQSIKICLVLKLWEKWLTVWFCKISLWSERILGDDWTARVSKQVCSGHCHTPFIMWQIVISLTSTTALYLARNVSPSLTQYTSHTVTIAFWHLHPDSARTGYATERAFFIFFKPFLCNRCLSSGVSNLCVTDVSHQGFQTFV